MSSHYRGCAFNNTAYPLCDLSKEDELCASCKMFLTHERAAEQRPEGCTCPAGWIQRWHVTTCKLRPK